VEEEHPNRSRRISKSGGLWSGRSRGLGFRKEHLLILALLLVAFGLRVWGLADHNIWWDEGLATWAARSPVRDILHWTAHDVHPPLYFLLLRGWWLLVGDGEYVLRFPSALVGTLGVGLIYGLARSLGGRRAGLWAALFLALSRFAIAWSQEMRMYIWAASLTAGALWAAVRLWRAEGRSRWAWAAYVLTVAGGLWSLFLMISAPLITNLAFPLVWLRAGHPRRLMRRWVTAQAAAAGLFIPWLIYALPRMPTWSTAEPFSPAFFVHLYTTMLAVGAPINLEAYTRLTVAVFGVLALGLVALLRTVRSPSRVGGLVMLGLGILLPMAVVYVVSLPIHLYYAPRLAPRYLLPLSVCFYALLGWGVAVLARRRPLAALASGGLVTAVALSGLVAFYPDRARRDDYLSLAAALCAHRQPGDEVLLHTDRDWPIFAAHYAPSWRGIPYGAPVDEATIEGVVAPLWERADGVWLVLTPDAQRVDVAGRVAAWLRERAVAVRRWDFGENHLHLYARTPARAATIHDLGPGFTPGKAPISAALREAELALPRYLVGDTAHLVLYWERPPENPVLVSLRDGSGAVRQEVIAPAPAPALRGPTRQQVSLPLTADLDRGEYRVAVWAGDGLAVEVARFDLLPRGAAVVQTADSPPDISHPLDFLLGEQIHLLGYDLLRTVVQPGETVALTLYWRAAAPVTVRYKVFTHLLGETYNAASGNFLWGQQDNEPVDGQLPTTTWAPGAVVADGYAIPVAADAPPGRYQIEVGMYGLVDGVRLPVSVDGELVGDHVLLASVEVWASDE